MPFLPFLSVMSSDSFPALLKSLSFFPYALSNTFQFEWFLSLMSLCVDTLSLCLMSLVSVFFSFYLFLLFVYLSVLSLSVFPSSLNLSLFSCFSSSTYSLIHDSALTRVSHALDEYCLLQLSIQKNLDLHWIRYGYGICVRYLGTASGYGSYIAISTYLRIYSRKFGFLFKYSSKVISRKSVNSFKKMQMRYFTLRKYQKIRYGRWF